MRLNRIYQNTNLEVGQNILLDKSAGLHLAKVLRLNVSTLIELFNGDGFRYLSEIQSIDRNNVDVKILKRYQHASESPLNLHLYQGVSRGDKMDLTLQKGVELGVKSFTPIITERCGVKLDAKRWAKKLEHWKKIIISACEQSGRDTIPTVNTVLNWEQALSELNTNSYFLDPHAEQSFRTTATPNQEQEIQLWVGPEGGFSEKEVTQIKTRNITPVLLGPRILRTETAALAAVAAINALWGDF